MRPHPDRSGEFEIVAGERRWRAAQRAGLHEIPLVVRRLTDVEALQIAIVENIQRADLSAIEEAEGYRRLAKEFHMSQSQIAETIGRSRSYVSNVMRLVDLPAAVRALLAEDKLTAGHARALLTTPNPVALAHRVVEEGLSVRQAEECARIERDGPPARPSVRAPARPAKSTDTMGLEQEISARLGLEVTISGDGPRGAITIRYTSLDQLDDLIQRLGGTA